MLENIGIDVGVGMRGEGASMLSKRPSVANIMMSSPCQAYLQSDPQSIDAGLSDHGL